MPAVSSTPPIDFGFLRTKGGGDAGARDLFQRLVGQLVATVRRGAAQIEGAGGDWGIDVYVGALEPAGTIAIWQAKYFTNGIRATQRKQIEASFATALTKAKEKGYTVRAWTLCLPCSLNPTETTWWNKFRRERARETGLTISLWDHTQLEKRLLSVDAAGIRRAYLDWDEPVVPLPVQPLPEDGRYDHALFVAQLAKARITEISSAQQQFFNSELLVREVTDKQVRDEIDELESRNAEVLALWEPRYSAYEADTNGDGRLLHAEVMKAVEGHHHATRPRALRASLIHTLGLMHRHVDGGRAGWCTQWREVAESHGR